MKRDMDLIRQILLKCEDLKYGENDDAFPIEGYSEDQVAYNCYLAWEAGLARGFETTKVDSPGLTAALTGLTWSGHDFLDAARDEERWKKTRSLGSLAIDATKQILIGLAIEGAKAKFGF